MLNRKLSLVALVLCFVILMSAVAFTAYEPFKVKLTMFERFVCLSLLPAEGNFITLKIVRELQMELAPTEAEAKLAGLENLPTGGVNADDWNAVELKEIVFGDIAKGLIVSALERLDKAEKLQQQHFELYEYFILGKKQEVKEGE